MKKLLLRFLGLVFLGAFLAGGIFWILSQSNREPRREDTRITIVASFYPLYAFTKAIAGDRVNVVNITPPGVEPHDFEPAPKDIAKIYAAAAVIQNGAGFDPWLERIKPELEKRNILVLDIGAEIRLDTMGLRDEAGVVDPHFWLDPVLVSEALAGIKKLLVQIDADGAGVYEVNFAAAKEALSSLDRKYREGLSRCERSEIIVSHDAFGYLANRYGLAVIPIAGLSPEDEPTPAEIARIVDIARSKNIRYVFSETLMSPRLSETVAREIGGGVLPLNPIEGLTEEELRAGKDYIKVMEENLVHLRKGLGCS